MHIDPSLQSKADNYKILTNLVVPRPNAWVSTIGLDSVVNLAPFSFFNAVSADPLYVALSIGQRDNGTPKDTLRNIQASGEFVVHLVTEELLTAMNISAAEFPPDQSEVTAAGLETIPSLRIKVPRLPRAQASMECTLFQTIALGSNTLIIGEVVMFHVADDLIAPGLHIDRFAPIGRLGSPSVYCRTSDRFELPRVTYSPTQQGN